VVVLRVLNKRTLVSVDINNAKIHLLCVAPSTRLFLSLQAPPTRKQKTEENG
jgi:hypothetical protein